MLLDNLKTLKEKIDSNLSLLDTKYPYARNLSRSLDILIQNNPNNTKAKMWIEGCIDMIVTIEKSLFFSNHKYNSRSKNRLLFLKKFITKHQNKLKDKFTQIDTFLNAINKLLSNEKFYPLKKPWIKGADKILIEIEKEFISLEYLGE